MRYSLEPTYRQYVKGYGFLSFANGNDKYGKNLLDTAKNKEPILLKQLVKKQFKRVQKLLEI